MLDESEVRKWVEDLLQQRSPEGVRPKRDTDLFTGGYLDSLGMIVLLTEISSQFGVSLSPDELNEEDFRTVDAVVALAQSVAGR